EPLANPYLYMASQIYAGLDGIARKIDPGPSADAPYEGSRAPLPLTLEHAIEALRADTCFREGFGEVFVNYYTHLKDAEIARCSREAKGGKENEVTEWEHREYLDLF